MLPAAEYLLGAGLRAALLQYNNAGAAALDLAVDKGHAGTARPGHCRSALPLVVIGWHSLGIPTVLLRPVQSFSVGVTVPPMARHGRAAG